MSREQMLLAWAVMSWPLFYLGLPFCAGLNASTSSLYAFATLPGLIGIVGGIFALRDFADRPFPWDRFEGWLAIASGVMLLAFSWHSILAILAWR